MPTDLPESPRAFLIVLGVLVVLALAGMAMREGRRSFHVGLIAAAAAVLTTLAFWQASPHSSWTVLLFQLFPAPVFDESARLIALFALPAASLDGKRNWITFALGFAALQAGAVAWTSIGQVAGPSALAAPLVVFGLHFALGLAALAMKARAAPPMLIFCVLALAHGGINGGWLAAMGAFPVWAIAAAQAVMILAYAGASFLLLRSSDSLRGEDRRLD